MANNDEFEALLNDKNFIAHYGGVIQGEKNKRLTGDFAQAAQTQPILFNKQFYFSHEMPSETVFSPDFIDNLMSYYKAAMPMNRFLAEAIAE